VPRPRAAGARVSLLSTGKRQPVARGSSLCGPRLGVSRGQWFEQRAADDLASRTTRVPRTMPGEVKCAAQLPRASSVVRRDQLASDPTDIRPSPLYPRGIGQCRSGPSGGRSLRKTGGSARPLRPFIPVSMASAHGDGRRRFHRKVHFPLLGVPRTIERSLSASLP
jgi:hypothetical protein